MLQRLPEGVVVCPCRGVEVEAHGAGEQDWLLGNDCNAVAEHAETQLVDVHAVDQNAAAARLQEAEEAHEQRALAGASAADNAHPLPCLDVEREAVEHEVVLLHVAHAQVAHANGSCLRPAGRRLCLLHLLGCLGGQARIVQHALHVAHVGLCLGKYHHQPAEHSADVEGVRHGEVGQRRAESKGHHHDAAAADRQRDDAAHEGGARAHPALDNDQRVQCHHAAAETVHVLLHQRPGDAEGPDRLEAVNRLGAVLVDGRAVDAVEAGQLALRGPVHHLEEVVDDADGDEENQEDRGSQGKHHHLASNVECADEHVRHCVRKRLIDNRLVLREPVEDAALRRAVEELNG
mmetsp:Transcript_10332/g.42021  ORF Transcript_10332/g.42021 Transcript_10332/m.42021 type:complete len:348 (+) Transcript_10332:2158-3201(+)